MALKLDLEKRKEYIGLKIMFLFPTFCQQSQII